jgi:hypothetical protein
MINDALPLLLGFRRMYGSDRNLTEIEPLVAGSAAIIPSL